MSHTGGYGSNGVRAARAMMGGMGIMGVMGGWVDGSNGEWEFNSEYSKAYLLGNKTPRDASYIGSLRYGEFSC